MNPHALRHTFATTCLQSGCDIKTLSEMSEILGHADANMTLKRYVHTDMKRKKQRCSESFRLYRKSARRRRPCRPDLDLHFPDGGYFFFFLLLCSLSWIFLFLSSPANADSIENRAVFIRICVYSDAKKLCIILSR